MLSGVSKLLQAVREQDLALVEQIIDNLPPDDLKRELGRDNALASLLSSLAHEIVHYQQWLKTGNPSERGVIKRTREILRKYSLTTATHKFLDNF